MIMLILGFKIIKIILNYIVDHKELENGCEGALLSMAKINWAQIQQVNLYFLNSESKVEVIQESAISRTIN